MLPVNPTKRGKFLSAGQTPRGGHDNAYCSAAGALPTHLPLLVLVLVHRPPVAEPPAPLLDKPPPSAKRRSCVHGKPGVRARGAKSAAAHKVRIEASLARSLTACRIVVSVRPLFHQPPEGPPP